MPLGTRWLVPAAAVSWRALVLAVAVLAACAALAQMTLVVLPVLLALLVATALVPLARWLERRGLPPALSALAALAGALGLLAGTVALVVPQVAAGWADLTRDVDLGYDALVEGMSSAVGLPGSELERLLQEAGDQLAGSAQQIGGGLLSGARRGVELVAGLGIALVLTFFFVKDRDTITGWLLARVPAALRDDTRAAAARAWRVLSGFLRGQAIVAAADAVGIGLGLLAIGVPLVLPLTVLTFLGGFVPLIGAFVSGLLAVLVALVSGGPSDALLTLAVVVVVQQLESNILQPMVQGRVLTLHPVVVLLAVTAGTVLAGIAGAFFAVPVTAAVVAAGNELRVRREGRAPA